MSRTLLLILLLPSALFAAEPAAQTSAAAGAVGGQLLQLILGLLLVVGLIFLLAWVTRRVQGIRPSSGKVIKIVASQALGTRDRLVLVQIGNEQILLGLTPGRISQLHVMKEPVYLADTEPASSEFAQRLMDLLGKDQKDKT